MKKFLMPFVTALAVISVIVNIVLYFRYSSDRPLIMVNNEPIRRKDLQDRLDFLYSNQILREMIRNKLIMQEARKEGCVPTPAEIDQAKAEILRTRPEVIATAYRIDPTLALFKETLTCAIALRSLRIKSVSITPTEVQQYYATHQDQFRLPRQASMQLVYAEDIVGAEQVSRMLANKVSLNVIASQNGVRVVGINTTNTSGIPDNIVNKMTALPLGAIMYYQVGQNYVIVQIKHVSPAGVPPLQSILPNVEENARLAKAPTENEELSRLVSLAKITAESDKYQAAIPQMGDANLASAQ